MEFLTKQQQIPLQASHPEPSVDNSDDSSGPSQNLAHLKDMKDNFEFLPELVHMPQITYKSHHSHKNTTNKRGQFEYPVSPLDVNYHVGCNNDLFSTATTSTHTQTSSQRKASN